MNKLSKKEKEALEIIHGNIDQALDLVIQHCEKYAKDNNIELIPLNYIRIGVGIIKRSIREGAKKTG